MGFIIDLLILTVIIVIMVLSARKGFVCTVVEVVGFVAAAMLAVSMSTPLADTVYDKFIEPPVVEAAQSASEQGAQNAVDGLWDALPDFITGNAEMLGLSKESIDQKLQSASEGSIASAATTASQSVAKPIVSKLLALFISTILLVVLLVVVKFLARFLNKLFSFSIVGSLNRTLGAVIGFFKGAIIAIVICMIISVLVSVTKEGFLIFTPEALANSYTFKILGSVLPMF